MRCRELAEFLMDYATGDLPPEVRAEFEQHLTRCHNCHEYLVEYENTIKAGHSERGPELEGDRHPECGSERRHQQEREREVVEQQRVAEVGAGVPAVNAPPGQQLFADEGRGRVVAGQVPARRQRRQQQQLGAQQVEQRQQQQRQA